MSRAPRSTRAALERAEAAQSRVIAALVAAGENTLAGRLSRCQRARSERRGRGNRYWPWRCGSAGCWACRRTAVGRWWLGMRAWIAEGDEPVSALVLPLGHRPGGLRVAVARLRRALRDVRDRTARRRWRWRGVAVAGMASGDGTAVLLVRHPGIGRAEVVEVLRRRWPDAEVGDVAAGTPSWAWSIEDAVELARVRRGVEPLRVIVAIQGGRDHGSVGRSDAPVEPLPLLL